MSRATSMISLVAVVLCLIGIAFISLVAGPGATLTPTQGIPIANTTSATLPNPNGLPRTRQPSQNERDNPTASPSLRKIRLTHVEATDEDPHFCMKPDDAYFANHGPATPRPAGSGEFHNPQFLFDEKHLGDKVSWAGDFTGTVIMCFVVNAKGEPENITFPQSPGADIEEHLKNEFTGWRFKPGWYNTSYRDREPHIVPTQLAYKITFRPSGEFINAPVNDPVSLAPAADQSVYSAPSPDIVNPVAISKPEPSYTPEAKKARYGGTFAVNCIVEKDGRLSSIEFVHTPAYGLDEKIREALAQWQFKPGTKNGMPVRVKAQINVTMQVY